MYVWSLFHRYSNWRIIYQYIICATAHSSYSVNAHAVCKSVSTIDQEHSIQQCGSRWKFSQIGRFRSCLSGAASPLTRRRPYRFYFSFYHGPEPAAFQLSQKTVAVVLSTLEFKKEREIDAPATNKTGAFYYMS